jgi:hypothetical protein
MPETGFCVGGGNLNASEEIVWREKKFRRLGQKKCTLSHLLVNSAPSLVCLRNLFGVVSFRLG